MCYGMNCEWELSSGDCGWRGKGPYPCDDRYKDEEDLADERYHEEQDRKIQSNGRSDSVS